MRDLTIIPKIGVIVPVYNVEAFLDKCLRSIVEQTYNNLEIIIVNDGSVDGGLAICEQYAMQDKRIRLVSQENQGLSNARNRGLDLLTSEYVCFVDSDDWIEPDYVEGMYNSLKKNNSDISCVSYYINTSECNKWQKYDGSVYVWGMKEAFRQLSEDKILKNYAWGKLYKASLFDNVRFPEGRLYEDIATIYKTILKSNIVSYISLPKYHYIVRSGSIVQNKSIEVEWQWVEGFVEQQKKGVECSVFEKLPKVVLHRAFQFVDKIIVSDSDNKDLYLKQAKEVILLFEKYGVLKLGITYSLRRILIMEYYGVYSFFVRCFKPRKYC